MYTIPRNPLGVVQYVFRALGQKRVSIEKLCFFLSFELRLMPPSKAAVMVNNLAEKGALIIDDGWVMISHDAKLDSLESPPSLGELLNQFVSPSRLSRAVGLDESVLEIQLKTKKPLRIEAIIHGTQDYKFLLDEESRVIGHNCPDWQKVRVIRRFCKHVAKVFLSLEEDEAVRLLLLIQQESWQFQEI